MKKEIFISLFLFIILSSANAQTEKKNFRIVSYNVENYFDCVNDSLTADEEYLPTGMRGWNYAKYTAKQNNIAKVIAAIGGWSVPAIVGLCEIESEKGMRELTQYSPLKNLHYKYIHHESPDARGVDVALMYQPDQFKPFYNKAIRVQFSDTVYKTRDILYVAGEIAATKDTLHIFLCHFPSRLGGELESENRRVAAATILKNKVDSILYSTPDPNIIIMGDFNDYPYSSSINRTLKATSVANNTLDDKHLYNLAYHLQEQGKGSHKFQSEWGMLDQMIVSGRLLNANNQVFTTENDMNTFDADFLLEDDVKFLGKKPFRTYNGMTYHGGFSDHLPIYVDLWY